MTDSKRSAIMRAVKAKDTDPELQVRRFIHGLAFDTAYIAMTYRESPIWRSPS